MTAREFLIDYYGTENCSVNYRPYVYGALVERYSLENAVTMLEKDINEMIEFFACFDNTKDIAEQAGKNGAFRIWKKHLVK